MIDTFMVLWNRGSRHRGARVCFTCSLVCISLFLFLVTTIIPGWILLARNDEGAAAARADEALLATAQSIDDNSAPVLPASPAINVASATSVACVIPAPDIHLSRSMGRRGQALPAAPVHPMLVQGANAKGFVAPHIVYSGRPRSAVSHLQASTPEISTPTAVASRNIFADATANPAVPVRTTTPSLQIPMQKAAQLHAHALFVAAQNDEIPMGQTASTPAVASSQPPIAHRQPAGSSC